MSRPRGSGGKAKELTQAEIKRIDRCLSGTLHEDRNRTLFYLCLGGGFRIAEAAGLRVKDVRPNGRVVNQVVLEKHSTKSGKSRTVFLAKQAQDQLKQYLDRRGPLNLNAALFPTQKKPNTPMHPNVAAQLMAKIFARAGVENASSHSLRRTHANTLRRNGTDIKIIKEQLGHASLQTTDAYFSVDPVEARRAVDGLRF